MKMKSFNAGLVNGASGALGSLDRQVKEELGEDIIVHIAIDTYHKQGISRVVVYSDAER